MCGFFFSIKNNSYLNEKKLISISNELSHRGPDDNKIINNKDFFVRFFRLSIIDIGSKASQPMHDKSGRYMLVFNGEIYNYKDLKKSLKNQNFKSNSDTEILLNLLIERGQKAIKELEGMFSFIFYDKLKGTYFFGRDRFGIKPLYYTKVKNNIIFSSEIKPLLKLNNFQINDSAFCDFFLKGSMDHNEHTFFRNIYAVKPGYNGLVKKDKIVIKKYWDLIDTHQSYKKKVSYNLNRSRLEYLLKSSLEKHQVSDRKIGLFLSGGTDSNAILNLIINKNQDQIINTFTYGFKNNSSSSEINRVKKIVSKSKKISNYTYLASPKDILENFDKTVKILEAPFTSIRIIAMKKLYELARKKGCVVILEGDGGDEIFGGYDYNLFSYLKDTYKDAKNKEQKILNELNNYVSSAKKNKSNVINLCLTNTHQYSSTSDGTIFVNSDFFRQAFLNKNISESYYDYKNHDHLNYLQNSQLKDIRDIKLPRTLKYKDRLSMSEGIEARLPLLDHELAEYSFNLPNNCKYKNLNSRYVFKDICQRKGFSKKMFEYSKRSIADPQKEWLRTHLKEFFLDSVNSLDFKNLKYFNAKAINSEFLKFCKDKNYPSTFAFFQVLSFYRFYKVFKNIN